ncbi:MAG: hypothetical protein HOP28_11175, partial [Gemmatimonadales bacterium]|nr:hypothetical protein [Gemmatimonadales bacterium]
MSEASRRRRWSGETIAVGAVLVAFLLANGVIAAARPAMVRRAAGALDSALRRERAILVRELQAWQEGMQRHGRWLADLAAVALEARPELAAGPWPAHEAERLGALVGVP